MLMTVFRARFAGSPLGPVVHACRGAMRTLGIASGIINLLTLTGSLFMMQVYDRVLGSHSVPTLLGLALIAIAAYLFQGWLDALRARVLTLVGEKIDADIAARVQAAGSRLAMASPAGAHEAGQAFRDLDAIRAFVTGQGLIAALDMPWVVLYVGVATLLHPLFGVTAIAAVALLAWLTWRTERVSAGPMKAAFDAGSRRAKILDANLRGAEAMHGNGMTGNRRRLWQQTHDSHLQAQRQAAFVVGGYASASRTARMVLQSFVLGLGSYLAIKGQITSGSIIAASIVVARGLAPIDQAIASWRPFSAARDALGRLTRLLAAAPDASQTMALPLPSRSFAVKDLAVTPPGSSAPTATSISFNLKAGDALGIVGASGSGKTTLLKAIVGAWAPARGGVAFDGSGPEQWEGDTLGRAIGYLPQDVQLFDGSIADNIARFDPAADASAIQVAAMSAGLDHSIRSSYPKTGYNTEIGANGCLLAGGMRQRIGLARALYGAPFLLVLDEPNANLDEEGSQALRKAIREARERKAIVIIATHRADVLEEVEYMMVMAKGSIEASGRRQDVLAKWLQRQAPRSDDALRAELAALAARRLSEPSRSSPTAARGAQSWSTPTVTLTGTGTPARRGT